MFGRVLKYISICILYLIAAYFLMVELALFLSIKDGLIAGTITRDSLTFSSFFTLDFNVVYWQGNTSYRNLALVIILIGFIYLIQILFFSKNKKNNNERVKVNLSRKEKRNYSHLANWFEKRSGLQRIDYNSQGELTNPMYSKLQSNIGTALIGNGLLFVFLFLIKLIIAIIRFIKAGFSEKFTILPFQGIWFISGNILEKLYELSGILLIITPLIFIVISSFPSPRSSDKNAISVGEMMLESIKKIVGIVQIFTAFMVAHRIITTMLYGLNFSFNILNNSYDLLIFICLLISIISPLILIYLQRFVRNLEINKINKEYKKMQDERGNADEQIQS